jgi:hypothetical protein
MTCCGLSAKNDDAAQQRIGLRAGFSKFPAQSAQWNRFFLTELGIVFAE